MASKPDNLVGLSFTLMKHWWYCPPEPDTGLWWKILVHFRSLTNMTSLYAVIVFVIADVVMMGDDTLTAHGLTIMQIGIAYGSVTEVG